LSKDLLKISISKHFLSIIPRQVWDLGVGTFNPFTTSQMIGLSKQELWLWDVNELNALSSTKTHTHTHGCSEQKPLAHSLSVINMLTELVQYLPQNMRE